MRVCDICDEQYIQRAILSEFKVKLEKKQSALDKLEREIREQQFRISDSQKEYDELCLKVRICFEVFNAYRNQETIKTTQSR